jgi:hypothetical protein
MKIENRSFERVEEFKYLGTTLTNQNSIQEEIMNRLKSVQDLLSFSFLSKKLKTMIYKIITLPIVCMGVEIGRGY